MQNILSYWIPTGIVMFLIFLGLGASITGKAWGILIDSRCKMSLSRFQLVMWTWLLVSAFFAVALREKTMNIEMPNEVWALMGISAGSAAGSIIIKGTKEAKEPASVDPAIVGVSRRGLLHIEGNKNNAKFSDMFKGEEITEFEYIDITKVQMFFFTIAALLGYAGSLWHLSLPPGTAEQSLPPGTAEQLVKFPKLSTSLVTLIGISHAGYLTVKAAPKTPSK